MCRWAADDACMPYARCLIIYPPFIVLQANCTPLHIASRSGADEVARSLLAKRAEVDPYDDSGQTPLWAAASEGHAEVVAALLDAGAALAACNAEPLAKAGQKRYSSKAGQTPLHVAALRKRSEVVAQLLARGAQVRARDALERTPLQLALAGEAEPVQLTSYEAKDAELARRLLRADPADLHMVVGADIRLRFVAGLYISSSSLLPA